MGSGNQGGTDSGLHIAPGIFIGPTELIMQAISSGGPGGQHVNRSATRISLRWNVLSSHSFTNEQRERLREKLSHRIDSEGWIRIVAGDSRSQLQNRRAALERLRQLIRRALREPTPRRATRPTKASIEHRLLLKRKRAEKKRLRRKRDDWGGDG